MNINYQNVHLSKDFYIHDSVFSGYHCDYDERKIQLSLLNEIEGVSQQFVLNNVINLSFKIAHSGAEAMRFIIYVAKQSIRCLDS